MHGYTLKFTTESLAEAHAAAAAKGKTLARHLHDLLQGGPAQVITNASGGKLKASLVRFAMEQADTIMDDPAAWGTAAGTWIEACDALVRWLKENPYRSEAPERCMNWWASMPPSVRREMEKSLDSLSVPEC